MVYNIAAMFQKPGSRTESLALLAQLRDKRLSQAWDEYDAAIEPARQAFELAIAPFKAQRDAKFRQIFDEYRAQTREVENKEREAELALKARKA